MLKNRALSMYYVNFVVAMLLSFGAMPNDAFSGEDEYKVAIVDLNRVVNSTDEAKEKQKELEELTKKADKEYNEKASKVKALEKAYMKSNDVEKRVELEKATRDLKLYISDTKEKIQKEFKDTNKRLIKNVMEVVEDYAEDNDIDLVFDKNSLVLGVVVYNHEAIDITEDIIRKVN